MPGRTGARGAGRPGGLTTIDLGRRRAYGPVWDLQKAIVAARHAGRGRDVLLLVEHEPVYTLGRHGRPDHLVWDERRRADEGIAFYRIDRGGDVTYHGPGQIVGYPILDLRALGLGVREYVERLEAGLIAACADFGVEARVIDGLPGVWVGDAKVAAIGIRCSRGVTSHGFALNVSTNLQHFDGIVPCGLSDRGVTSLERELGRSPGWAEVARSVAHRVAVALGFDDAHWAPAERLDWLPQPGLPWAAGAGGGTGEDRSAPEQVAQ